MMSIIFYHDVPAARPEQTESRRRWPRCGTRPTPWPAGFAAAGARSSFWCSPAEVGDRHQQPRVHPRRLRPCPVDGLPPAAVDHGDRFPRCTALGTLVVTVERRLARRQDVGGLAALAVHLATSCRRTTSARPWSAVKPCRRPPSSGRASSWCAAARRPPARPGRSTGSSGCPSAASPSARAAFRWNASPAAPGKANAPQAGSPATRPDDATGRPRLCLRFRQSTRAQKSYGSCPGRNPCASAMSAASRNL
jgi:hypothetical protein